MKITFRTGLRNQGSILFLTLILAIVMGISLGSYLILTSGQEKSVSRSQRWNAALDSAEAGIEDGLAQVNNSPKDFSANGWTAGSGTYGPENQTLSGGRYSVLVVGSTTPTLYSTGYVTAPITGETIQRAVRVTTQVMPLFNVALGAVGNINMNGNSMATDSWNSHDPNLSVNGTYSPLKTSTNGDVASEQGIVNIGQHTIDGNLYLGPTATYVSGTNQILGDLDKDYNVNFPDASLPTNLGNPVPASMITTNGPPYYNITLNGYYVVPVSLPIKVAAGLSNVVIKVTAMNMDLSSITIGGGMTNPATVTVYDAPPVGGSLTLGGNSTANSGSTPVNFIIYGLPTLTTINLGGTSMFLGAIYAPEATLNMNGGGSSNDFLGAVIVKTATMNGHYDFHYDEALGALGPAKGFMANSWQEL
jgi:hypothetical protein